METVVPYSRAGPTRKVIRVSSISINSEGVQLQMIDTPGPLVAILLGGWFVSVNMACSPEPAVIQTSQITLISSYQLKLIKLKVYTIILHST